MIPAAGNNLAAAVVSTILVVIAPATFLAKEPFVVFSVPVPIVVVFQEEVIMVVFQEEVIVDVGQKSPRLKSSVKPV